jgi:uncharacterized protein YdeI (YjbR/CyaY-like superfamily)
MPAKSSMSQWERVTAPDRAAWRAWLAEHHASAPGVWLVLAKKGADQPSVSYIEAVEEALCFGWIDSLAHSLDATRYEQVFSPRKRKSPWSKPNKERIARLEAVGLMTPTGLAAVEAAKADGTWAVFDGLEDLQVPDDLRAALAANPLAERHFAAFSAAVRQQSLWWIAQAKRPATRQRRIAQVVSAAAESRNPRATPPKAPPEK